MKHVVRYILTLAVGIFVLVGCSDKRIISDSDLEKITEEMFIVNAYASAHSINTDSLDIYTPILQKYGYTQEDFFNTLANFQTRKSARFSDIIENTVANLDVMSKEYMARLKRKKQIDSLAKEEFKKELFFIDTLRVTKMKDTTKLKLSIPIRSEGEIIVSYNYTIDTLDKNLRLQSNHEQHDAEGNRLHVMRNNLSGGGKQKEYKTSFVIKEGATTYELALADYAHREDEPHIAFGNVRITYLPTKEEALEKMDSLVRLHPFDPEVDTIFRRSHFLGKVPLLPTDTVWIESDSITFASIGRHRTVADSLMNEASKVRTERDKFAAKHTKKRSVTISQKMNSLRGQIDSLEECAATSRAMADSLEQLLFGKITTTITRTTEP